MGICYVALLRCVCFVVSCFNLHLLFSESYFQGARALVSGRQMEHMLHYEIEVVGMAG